MIESRGVVPYIERVTRPGMGVVFLIHHPVSGLKWLQAYCGIMECGLDNALMLRKMMESYAVKTRRQLAEQKVFQTCQDLHRLGVKTAVEVYSGSLTKNLKSYVSKGDAQLVLERSGMDKESKVSCGGRFLFAACFNRRLPGPCSCCIREHDVRIHVGRFLTPTHKDSRAASFK